MPSTTWHYFIQKSINKIITDSIILKIIRTNTDWFSEPLKTGLGSFLSFSNLLIFKPQGFKEPDKSKAEARPTDSILTLYEKC